MDKLVIILLCGISIIGIFSYFHHENPIKTLDLTSRYILTVPILILLIFHPPKKEWLWAGIACGCAFGSMVAIWQVDIQGLARASGSTGGIQFGNLGLLMGIFSATLAYQAWRSETSSQRVLWSTLLIVGAIGGVYASIASGSRGGWIALPFIGILFCFSLASRRTTKHFLFGLLLVASTAFVVALTVPTIAERFQDAVSDVQQYKEGDPYTSIGQRLAMYEFLADIIPRKPWFGWSISDFKAEQVRQVSTGETSDAILILGTNTHNTYLETLVFMGAIGLFVLVAIFIVAFIYFARSARSADINRQASAISGMVLVVGYGVTSLTQQMLSRNNTLLFFLISMAVFWALARPTNTK